MMVFRARTVWWNEIGSLTFSFDDLLYVYVPLGSCGHAPCSSLYAKALFSGFGLS